MSISSEPATTELKQTDKRKNRSNNQEQVFKRPACRGAGLEETSGPDDFESRHQKRRSNARANRDKEQKDNDMDDDDDTHHGFWQASANAVKGADLSEPSTFEDAINGPDKVHWRKAICAELDSMKLHCLF